MGEAFATAGLAIAAGAFTVVGLLLVSGVHVALAPLTPRARR
jgi:hypothetical protein